MNQLRALHEEEKATHRQHSYPPIWRCTPDHPDEPDKRGWRKKTRP